MKKIGIRELRKMARFYEKELFYGLPEIEISFKVLDEGTRGLFRLKKNEWYDPWGDELIDEPPYSSRYVDLGNGVGIELNDEESWEDPLNHPRVSIEISTRLCKDIFSLTWVLLHELCHYYCWYVGLDYHDYSSQYLKVCKDMGIPTNFDFKWDKENRVWVKQIDHERIESYIKMYEGRKAA